MLPVPAPAVVELLLGHPTRTSEVDAELTTPTGAALLAGLATRWGALPPMTVEAVGYGAGTRELPDRANVARFVLGRPLPGPGAGDHLVIEADLDDVEPQVLATFTDSARERGALDVTQGAVVMKKGRSGVRLTILCTEATREELIDALFHETTTIGCRWHAVRRAECEREVVEVSTPYGPIRMKRSRWRGRVVNEKPEHDDCVAAARRHGVPVSRVALAALAAGCDGEDGRRHT